MMKITTAVTTFGGVAVGGVLRFPLTVLRTALQVRRPRLHHPEEEAEALRGPQGGPRV